jgi:hypothetical protein
VGNGATTRISSRRHINASGVRYDGIELRAMLKRGSRDPIIGPENRIVLAFEHGAECGAPTYGTEHVPIGRRGFPARDAGWHHGPRAGHGRQARVPPQDLAPRLGSREDRDEHRSGPVDPEIAQVLRARKWFRSARHGHLPCDCAPFPPPFKAGAHRRAGRGEREGAASRRPCDES